jgi:hypothetical protein
LRRAAQWGRRGSSQAMCNNEPNRSQRTNQELRYTGDKPAFIHEPSG